MVHSQSFCPLLGYHCYVPGRQNKTHHYISTNETKLWHNHDASNTKPYTLRGGEGEGLLKPPSKILPSRI